MQTGPGPQRAGTDPVFAAAVARSPRTALRCQERSAESTVPPARARHRVSEHVGAAPPASTRIALDAGRTAGIRRPPSGRERQVGNAASTASCGHDEACAGVLPSSAARPVPASRRCAGRGIGQRPRPDGLAALGRCVARGRSYSADAGESRRRRSATMRRSAERLLEGDEARKIARAGERRQPGSHLPTSERPAADAVARSARMPDGHLRLGREPIGRGDRMRIRRAPARMNSTCRSCTRARPSVTRRPERRARTRAAILRRSVR